MAQDVRQDIEVIANRLKAGWLAHQISQDQVQTYLSDLRADGTWPDVDYEDESPTHWSPATHTSRLADLAEVFCATQNEAVKDAVLRGLTFWAQHDPQSSNWWWNCISSPSRLSKTLLLMGDAVSEDLVDAVAKQVHRSSFKRTGANLTNEASNLLVLACAAGDVDLVRESIAHLTGEIRVVFGEEGIQVDNSFHQHGPQLQMGSYAGVFMRDATEHALLFEGTQFALSKEQISILANYVIEGQQWFAWGHRMDFHGMGRGAGRTGNSTGSRSLGLIAERMAQIDPAHKEIYERFSARTRGDVPPGQDAPLGNRQYYRSDIMVHRPGHFHTSVRMHSTRTYACEVRVNRENLKGYHLSDGAYFVMQTGDEYLDIQPVWDWRKLPGVTYRDTDASFPYGRDVPQRGNTDFVGGVSDGYVGLAAMDFAKDDVQAYKTYFFFEDGFVCLGAGIAAELDEPVTTSVNQCLLQGEVLVLGDSLVSVGRGRMEADGVRGVYHDGIGYYFLGDQNVVVRSGKQTGSWKDLEEKAPDIETIQKDIFNLWVDHGEQPDDGMYAYAVMPGMKVDAFETRAKALPFHIVAQTPEVQAVEFAAQSRAQMAFFEAGQVDVLDDVKVDVDVPCLVMVQKTESGVQLTVADPAQKHEQVRIIVSGKYAGDGARVADDETVVRVPLPQKEWAGQSVQVLLQK